MGDFLIWLSGASRRVLGHCETERSKFVGLGAAILVTAGMAAVSMGFALYNALKASLPVAILFALLWGLAILSLDRLFVVSMRRFSTAFFSFLMALPRFAMAVLLGFVISTPFVLQIFRPEIQYQVKIIREQQQKAYFNSPGYLQLTGEIQQYQNKVAEDAQEAKTGGSGIDPSKDPTIEAWQSQLSAATAKKTAAYNTWQCQLYGTAPNGSTCHPAGNGVLAKADQGDYINAKNQVSTLQTEIQTRTNQLENESPSVQQANKAQAAAKLKQDTLTLHTDQGLLQQQKSGFTSSIDNDNGILIQLQGLDAAASGSATLWWTRALLFLVFLCIDVIPVFMKLLLNLAPESAYDRELGKVEIAQSRAAEQERASWLAQRRSKAQADIASTRDRLSGLSAPLSGVRDDLIKSRLELEAEWRRRWESEQRRKLAGSDWIYGPGIGEGPIPPSGPQPRTRTSRDGFRDWSERPVSRHDEPSAPAKISWRTRFTRMRTVIFGREDVAGVGRDGLSGPREPERQQPTTGSGRQQQTAPWGQWPTDEDRQRARSGSTQPYTRTVPFTPQDDINGSETTQPDGRNINGGRGL